MDAGAERQRPRAAAVGGDVEAVGLLVGGLIAVEVAVAGERADHHDRALREGHVAVDDLLGEDARGEGRDRLVAQRLLDGGLGERRVLGERAATARGVRRAA